LVEFEDFGDFAVGVEDVDFGFEALADLGGGKDGLDEALEAERIAEQAVAVEFEDALDEERADEEKELFAHVFF
jgi:hypothetical protein